MKNNILIALETVQAPTWIKVERKLSAYEKRGLAGGLGAASANEIANLMKHILKREDVEYMFVICLDGRNNVKHIGQVSQGGLHGCAVSVRDILRIGLVAGASAIVLCHNHPSGNSWPSPEDISMTKAVCKASEVIGIPLVDHVIVAGDSHTSMLEMGLMNS